MCWARLCFQAKVQLCFLAHSESVGATAELDPRGSDFEGLEAAELYVRWFRTKIEAVMAAPHLTIPHDQVMAEMEAIMVARESARLPKV